MRTSGTIDTPGPGAAGSPLALQSAALCNLLSAPVASRT
ncbi:hypothetical protein JOF36_001617 [Pseudonocardia parietis]|uniref:Uncharacterized protein n=1 Tax=Pseudonocardia parietis TaxID=570936 RepID=A0ABS4VQ56_9PSEU|nr:hypothetical protein [Pseudonocardia parietis]